LLTTQPNLSALRKEWRWLGGALLTNSSDQSFCIN
jgi:hypothetical protein